MSSVDAAICATKTLNQVKGFGLRKGMNDEAKEVCGGEQLLVWLVVLNMKLMRFSLKK